MTNEEMKNKLINFKKIANVNRFNEEFTIDRLIDANNKLDDNGCEDCNLFADFTNFVNKTHSLDVNKFIDDKINASDSIKKMMINTDRLFTFLSNELVNDLTEFIDSGDFIAEFCNNEDKYNYDEKQLIDKLPTIADNLINKLGKNKVADILLKDRELKQQLIDKKEQNNIAYFDDNELMVIVRNYVFGGNWLNSEKGYYVLQNDMIDMVKEDIKNG